MDELSVIVDKPMTLTAGDPVVFVATVEAELRLLSRSLAVEVRDVGPTVRGA